MGKKLTPTLVNNSDNITCNGIATLMIKYLLYKVLIKINSSEISLGSNFPIQPSEVWNMLEVGYKLNWYFRHAVKRYSLESFYIILSKSFQHVVETSAVAISDLWISILASLLGIK